MTESKDYEPPNLIHPKSIVGHRGRLGTEWDVHKFISF